MVSGHDASWRSTEIKSAAAPAPQSLGLFAQLTYGAGQVAGQVFRDVPSLLLLFFMTSILGIDPALAGTAIFLPKLIGGVVFDLTVGLVSDKMAARFDRRHWLLIGVISAPAAIIALFSVPAGDEASKVAYVATIFSLYMAVYATFSVPYLAIAGDLILSPHQRTVLMAGRLVFSAVGILIAGAVAPAYIQANGGGEAGYRAMAILLGGLCAICLVIAWFGSGFAAKKVGTSIQEQEALTWAGTRLALSDQRFSVLAGVTLLQLSAGGMSYAAMLYFMSYNMALPDALAKIGFVVLLACVGIVIAQPMWVKLSTRFGKVAIYVAAALVHAIAHIGFGLSTYGGLGMLYAFAVVLGIGNSGWSMIGASLLTDIAGEGKAGLYSAVWVALDKIGFALGGALIIGLILSAFGFDSAAAKAGLPQSDQAIFGILLAFSLAPAACNILAATVFAKWGKAA
jgi:glycoside/pentoside/hexuronide:cation symporter, GPH family